METLAHVTNLYSNLYHNDSGFFYFCVVFPILSVGSFFFFAFPLSLLTLVNPSWLQPYYIQEKRPSSAKVVEMILSGVYYSLMNHTLLLGALFAVWPFSSAKVRAVIEFDGPMPHPVLFLVQLLIIVYLEDMLYYHSHRMLHTNKFLYKYVHALHHTVHTPIALSGHYMSPFEFLTIGGTVLVAPMLLGLVTPVHIYVVLSWLVWREWEAAEGHCGMKLPVQIVDKLLPFYDGPAYHDFHHSKVLGNYGGLTGIHDRIFDTFSSGFLQHMNRKQ